MSNFYEILEVEQDCSQGDIKKAYRKLAMKYHPDRNHDDESAIEKFKEVNEAHEVLSNERSRQNYDLGIRGNDSGFFNNKTGFNIHDIMNEMGGIGSFFEQHLGQQQRQANKIKQRNIIVNLDADISLIVSGARQKVNFNRRVVCKDCKGKRTKEKDGIKTCDECKGSGQMVKVSGSYHIRVSCPDCLGEGQSNIKPCIDCQGKGYLINRECIPFEVPKGCPEGYSIQIKEKGHEYEESKFGDLMIAVRCAPHPLFQRVTHTDIQMQFPIPVHCAIAGLKIEIPTVHGLKEIDIPQGVQDGQRITCKGMGIPFFENPEKNGDLHVACRLETPSFIDNSIKEIMNNIPIDKKTYPYYQSLIDEIKEAQAL